MPNNIRAGLSVLVALVAIVVFLLEMDSANGALKWIALGLGAFMIYAVWLFPEAKESDDEKGS